MPSNLSCSLAGESVTRWVFDTPHVDLGWKEVFSDCYPTLCPLFFGGGVAVLSPELFPHQGCLVLGEWKYQETRNVTFFWNPDVLGHMIGSPARTEIAFSFCA